MNKFLITMAVMLLSFLPAQAQNIKFIVPFPVGGSTDVVARIIADGLTKELSQTVTVENRTGAGGAIATREIARSRPDGSVIGISTVSTFASNMIFQEDVGYHPLNDFIHVMIMAHTPKVMVVRSDFPGSTSPEILKNMTNRPINIGVSSQSTDEVYANVLKKRLGSGVQVVQYKGGGPALIDLLGGHVDAVIENLPSMIPYLRDGRLKLVAVSWPTRFEDYPLVPTWDELNLHDINESTWYGVVIPAGGSSDIVQRLHRAMTNVLKNPDIRSQLIARGAYPMNRSVEQSTRLAKLTLEKIQSLGQQHSLGRYQK